MTFRFVVESGAGLVDANAYATVGFVDDYHASRNNTDWTAETSLAISAVTPVGDTLTRVAHGLAVGAGPFAVASTGTLPGGLTAGVAHWVQAAPTVNTLTLALAPGGVVVDITSAGSGTITLVPITKKAAAIIRATDYLESTYRDAFLGAKWAIEQALHFPADDVYIAATGQVIAGVPVDLQRATAELALSALARALDSSSGDIVSESRSGGGISRSVTYASSRSGASYPAADRWLRSLLRVPMAVRA